MNNNPEKKVKPRNLIKKEMVPQKLFCTKPFQLIENRCLHFPSKTEKLNFSSAVNFCQEMGGDLMARADDTNQLTKKQDQLIKDYVHSNKYWMKVPENFGSKSGCFFGNRNGQIISMLDPENDFEKMKVALATNFGFGSCEQEFSFVCEKILSTQ